MSKIVDKEFMPNLIHPFYIIRKGLLKGIIKYTPYCKGKMLDFGCGSKPYRNLFNVDEYIGIDFENEGHSHENEQIDVYYDGLNIPFPDNSFDSILCSEVFEHLFNLEHTLKELNRVLKPGGHILITCPFVWNEHEKPYDYARYTLFALTDLLERNYFTIIKKEKIGNFVTTITQMIVLYLNEIFVYKHSRLFPIRWFYKFFLVLIPNSIGLLFNKIFPENDSLYLNNLLVVQKSNE
jgi:SAM-dependent methyltransferase